MKRKHALQHGFVEGAMHGECTAYATRILIENRVSYTAFMEAVQSGINNYDKRYGVVRNNLGHILSSIKPLPEYNIHGHLIELKEAVDE